LWVGDTAAWPTVVSNVIPDFPANSHLQMDGLLPISDEFQKSFLGTNFGVLLGPTYLRLRPHVDIPALDSSLTKTLHGKFQWLDMRLQPVSEIHAGSADINYDDYNFNKIDGKYIHKSISMLPMAGSLQGYSIPNCGAIVPFRQWPSTTAEDGE
jgi:putative ABC transport system permease protein